ncbi:hypothetical protein GUJ93_ZPchr0006g42417 [Zizania palustris]|uniref:Uncharacterized protein n=1 Tax=Zizania palustris TaxID=103762 RepID=A0A8J5TBQ7_ZIZPA|nr:hypothetical protein GUJ93_ZPchr0006g42417 [Zizania palustris]
MERSGSYSEKSSSKKAAAVVADLRCHSASYVSSKYAAPPMDYAGKAKMKAKSTSTWPSSSSSAGSKARAWSGLGDPELQRRRRVAGYRVYGVEGKVKGSLKSGVRWIKGKCTRVVDGWW